MPQTNLTTNDDVLTLEEAAQFLRVSSEGLKKQADYGRMPAQLIDGEWRFLKSALAQWLSVGPRAYEEIRRLPFPFWPDHPVVEEWLHVLEKRIAARLDPPVPKRGTKEAGRKHFGVFKDDDNLEEMLASMRAIRQASE